MITEPKPNPTTLWGIIDDDGAWWSNLYHSEADANEAIESFNYGDGDCPVRLVPESSVPAWRENPTCPGLWMRYRNELRYFCTTEHETAEGGPWYGPIPPAEGQ